MAFTESQIASLEVAERSTSVLSLVGSLFIITTFTFFPTFRKPINRLVMYASLGNVLCNIATLVSVSGMQYGEGHPLCKFQAFLIQMFIPADSLWTFCMSLNVYLTFFKSCDAAHLRALEKWYFIFCYGTPLIPAITFLLMDAGGQMGIYGPATLWCWIAVEWDWMRIAFFYGPVWIIIAITTAIYLITGKAIFKHRAALRAFSKNPTMPLPLIENPFTADNLAAVTKVTEIEITTETVECHLKTAASDTDTRSSFASTRKLSRQEAPNSLHPSTKPARNSNNNNNNAAWPYPSNTGTDAPATAYHTTTITAGVPIPQNPPPVAMDDESLARQNASNIRRRNAAMHANTAAWGYAKVAMLMFVALFIVWVPSTINRVYSLAHPQKPNFALSFFAGLVLPLQGFWNAMVYISTSWSQCRTAYQDIFSVRRPTVGSANTRNSLNTRPRQHPSYYHHTDRNASKESHLESGLAHSDIHDIDMDDADRIFMGSDEPKGRPSISHPPSPSMERSDSTIELTSLAK